MPDQVPQAAEDVIIQVRLCARDVRWATFQYASRSKFNLFILAFAAYEGWLAGPVAAVGLILLAGLVVAFLSPWFNAWMSSRNPNMKEPFVHTFTGTGILSQFKSGSVSANWSLVRKASESTKYIAIWGKTGIPLTIPKVQLTPVEILFLRRVLRQHLGDKANLQRP